MAIRAADLDLSTGRHGLSELACDEAADTEDRRVEPSAVAWPLRQPLTGADHRRAGRVLLEAARQLAVLDVLEEGLQLVLVFGFERDGEVSEPDDLEAVAVDVALYLRDGFGLDLVGVSRDPEQWPAVGNDVRDDVGPQRLEELLAHPVGDLVVGREVLGADQVHDQRLRFDDLQGVLTEDAQPNAEVGLGVDDVVDGTAKGKVGKFAGGDEVELGAE